MPEYASSTSKRIAIDRGIKKGHCKRRFKRTLYNNKAPEGRQARFHKPVVTAEQHEAADVEAARRHFVSLGWEAAEVAAGDVDAQLDAVLARARSLQEFARRCRMLAPSARAAEQPPAFG